MLSAYFRQAGTMTQFMVFSATMTSSSRIWHNQALRNISQNPTLPKGLLLESVRTKTNQSWKLTNSIISIRLRELLCFVKQRHTTTCQSQTPKPLGQSQQKAPQWRRMWLPWPQYVEKISASENKTSHFQFGCWELHGLLSLTGTQPV